MQRVPKQKGRVQIPEVEQRKRKRRSRIQNVLRIQEKANSGGGLWCALKPKQPAKSPQTKK